MQTTFKKASLDKSFDPVGKLLCKLGASHSSRSSIISRLVI